MASLNVSTTELVEFETSRDEPQKRGNWGGSIEFILTCVGYAVGLGNVWRFPYLCYENGGGAFLIPYLICLIALGLPLFCLELTLGQYSGRGPVDVWCVSPIMKGVGFTMVLSTSVIAIYYNVIIAHCIYFLFASMTSELPWASCTNDWNSCSCLALDSNATRPHCLNMTDIVRNVSPSAEYYYNHVIQETGGIEDPGVVRWELALSLLLAWTIVFVVLLKGIQSMGKVMYFTAIFPYILLTILLIRGLTLDGHGQGIDFYLSADWDKLSEAKVWSDAATQIFYSLSTCSGGLIAMSSYNKLHNNHLRDSLLVPVVNCLTSFYAGFVIFSVLGFMANAKGTTIDNVAAGGPGLAFVVYPEGIATMPVSPLWAILFFFMMSTLGFSSQFSIVETIITTISDEFPAFLRRKKISIIFRFCVCMTGFLLGLPMVTQGGFYLLDLVDDYISGFPLLFVGLFETLIVSWAYGFWKVSDNIEYMLGEKPWFVLKFFYLPFWMVITPVLLLMVIIFLGIQYEPYKYRTGLFYPEWAETIGILIVVFVLLFIPCWALYYYIRQLYEQRGQKKVLEITRECFKPLPKWGPQEDTPAKSRASLGGRVKPTEENGLKSSNTEIGNLPKYVPCLDGLSKSQVSMNSNGSKTESVQKTSTDRNDSES
ncbi:hypothetical protein ScPMuIL_017034 [Solemya velum]